MSDSVSDHDAIYGAFSMIDLERWGPTKLRIVATILRLERDDGWTYIGHRDLAKRVRCSPRYAYDLVNATTGTLWRNDRVLIRGLVGAGHRGTAYRVRHPSLWCVPWLETNLEIRASRLGRAPYRDAKYALESRSRSATLDNVESRSRSATLDSPESRSRSATLGIPSVAPLDRDAKSDDSAVSSNCPGDADASLSRGGRERASGAAQRLQEAIEAKTGAGCWGRLLDQIDRLVATYDLDVLLAGVETAPERNGPPGVVQHCERVAKGTAPAVKPKADVVSLLIRRREKLELLIKSMVNDNSPVPESLQAELAECENRLQEIEEEA